MPLHLKKLLTSTVKIKGRRHCRMTSKVTISQRSMLKCHEPPLVRWLRIIHMVNRWHINEKLPFYGNWVNQTLFDGKMKTKMTMTMTFFMIHFLNVGNVIVQTISSLMKCEKKLYILVFAKSIELSRWLSVRSGERRLDWWMYKWFQGLMKFKIK